MMLGVQAMELLKGGTILMKIELMQREMQVDHRNIWVHMGDYRNSEIYH
jgi:hypothetical protein